MGKILFCTWKLLLIVAFIWWLTKSFDLLEVYSALNSRLIVSWLSFQVFNLLALPILCYRLGFLLEYRVPFRTRMAAVLMAMGANVILPGRTAEFIKPVVLAKFGGVPLVHGIAATVIERSSDVFSLVIICIILQLFNPPNWDNQILIFSVITFIVLGGCYLISRKGIIFLKNNILIRKINFILSIIANYKPVKLLKSIIASLSILSLGVLAFWIFIYIGEIPKFDLIASLELFIAAILAYAIPGLPAGLGLFEAAIVLVLGWHGIRPDAALSIAVMLHISQVTMGVVGGSFFFLSTRLSNGKSTTNHLL
jgi:uncharacterized membrane protein YbhN (UPF0104 family)